MTSDPTPALTHLANVDALDKMSGQLRRQAVRDARSAGAHITEIALVLGIRNRNGLYAILDEKPPPAVEPAPTAVVFLRGAKVDAAIWRQASEALHARGWVVVRDRTQAWHLARGRVPVVLVDISNDEPRVGLVKARYSDDKQTLELPLAGEATHVPALDFDAVALAVIDQLHTAPTTAPKQPAEDRTGAAAAWTPIAPVKTGKSTKRSVAVPKALRTATRAAVDAGRAKTDQQLIAAALHTQLTTLERKHGSPFPPVDRLPTGPRAAAVQTQDTEPWSITLDESEWAWARAAVAAGAARSLPELFTGALQSYLPS